MKFTRAITMKKIGLGTLLILCLAATVWSQEQPPRLLFHAAQCLASKKFLSLSKATMLTFGYVLDEKSYPGQKLIYVVQYAAPARSNGQVYAVFVTEHDGHQVFNIQNNAKFVLSKRESSGVPFVTPPLGGTWMHEHLASAVRQIEKQPRFQICVKDLSSLDASVGCEAYTDPQRRRGGK
jgi:hypothetical protein